MTDDDAAAFIAARTAPHQPSIQPRSVDGAVDDVSTDATAYVHRHQNTLVIASGFLPRLDASGKRRPVGSAEPASGTGSSMPPEAGVSGSTPLPAHQRQAPARRVHGERTVSSLRPDLSAVTERAATTSLTLRHRHLPGTSVIAVGGEIDLANSGQLACYVKRVRRPGDHVVFDLTEVSFLDCSGLRVLISSHRQATADNAGVRLAGVRGVPARLLQLVRLQALLPVHSTVEQALATILTT
ncbi:STAS domain-containing protein [Nonomuraea ceibae]|uniref:STAS domain-containing protein n=1 Tax=Nonomuraea ceibae TaxID=1935170 RepID=UPI001C5F2EA0|nr:STAS domain-containing protein [Nonomuraea ceibae]